MLRLRARRRQVELPEVSLPRRIELPELSLPRRIELPRVSVPRQIALPELSVPRRVDVPVPEIRRGQRTSPVVVGLKFVVGLSFGLFMGALVAALLAPAAGEDTRNKLKSMVPRRASGGRYDAATGGGLLDTVKARFRRAIEEAKQTRAAREQELMAEYEVAKRTGSAP
ncbi:MAG TPA: hypothetical protein VFC93_13020 [Chloroflexota bacterium]|nr:hypothetical protein [Chloroflexota bacterium]